MKYLNFSRISTGTLSAVVIQANCVFIMVCLNKQGLFWKKKNNAIWTIGLLEDMDFVYCVV